MNQVLTIIEDIPTILAGKKLQHYHRFVARSTASLRYKYLCELLKEAREKKEISQRELARRMNKHHTEIWKVENGLRRFDPIQFFDLAEALGVDFCKLLKQAATYQSRAKGKTLKKS